MPVPASNFALPEVDREHRVRVEDMKASMSNQDLAQAFLRCMSIAAMDPFRVTPHRTQWRAFFEAAQHLPRVSFTVTYFKKHGGLRHMLATIAGAGIGNMPKYVTLWDLEAEGYRQVNLDGIVKVTMDTGTFIPHEVPIIRHQG